MSKIFALLKRGLLACCILYMLIASPNVSAAPGDNHHAAKDKFFAQITGTVKDRLGKPISGVTVSVVGSAAKLTTTGDDGRFTIDVDPKGSLQFTHVNYKTVVMAVNNTLDLEVFL